MKISEIIYQTLPREEKVFNRHRKTLKKKRSKINTLFFKKESFENKRSFSQTGCNVRYIH
jgi:hypothetical protein